MAIKTHRLALLLTSLFACLLLLPSLTFADPQWTAGLWPAANVTAMNVTVYLQKNLVGSSTTVTFTYACTANKLVGEATCPSNGQFSYTIPKTTDPTKTFPYYIYEKSISRTTRVPDNNWMMNINKITMSSGTRAIVGNTSYPISKVMNNTVATFDVNGTGSNTVPTDAKPATDPYVKPVPAASTTTAATTSTASQGGPFTVLFPFVNIQKQGIDASKCTNGDVYTVGILKGIPCKGAIDSVPQVLTFIKNIVLEFLLPTVGTIFLIMILLGGILYITSRGNQTQLDRAKKTLTAAIIGLLIVTLSYTLIAIYAGILGGGVSLI